MRTIFRVLIVLFSSMVNIVSAHDLSKAPKDMRNTLKPETLEIIDLSKELPGLDGRQLRMRKVVLQRGGAIPPHSHSDRPAIVYVLQGRVREHRSDQDVPLVYGAGESMTEHAAVHHWIENISDEPVIGIVVDIPNPKGATAFTEEQILKSYGLKKHQHH